VVLKLSEFFNVRTFPKILSTFFVRTVGVRTYLRYLLTILIKKRILSHTSARKGTSINHKFCHFFIDEAQHADAEALAPWRRRCLHNVCGGFGATASASASTSKSASESAG
jgi:hypothetical protein